MEHRERYQLKKSIPAIQSDEGVERIAVNLPIGAIVTLQNGRLDGDRMVEVSWEGKKLMMFTVDLRERATLVAMPVATPIRGSRPRLGELKPNFLRGKEDVPGVVEG